MYRLEYHLVWCVKDRRAVLEGEIAADLREILRDVASHNGLGVTGMDVAPDHVHLLLDATPQHVIPDVVKALKGASARRVFSKHPDLKQQLPGGHLWHPSYFVATAGENIPTEVRRYVERHSAADEGA